ncbi:MAG: FitA-like ribbon-helix-helix domain-containing protein [Geminicoccaceae bacterium]
MPKVIQIRNVPDEVRRALKARAAKAGMSLSAFLLHEVRKVLLHEVGKSAGKLTIEEALERARKRGPVVLDEDPAVTIRRLRGPMP